MVKVDLQTAKPLRREEWGQDGLETKVGRRKKAGCCSRKNILEWNSAVYTS